MVELLGTSHHASWNQTIVCRISLLSGIEVVDTQQRNGVIIRVGGFSGGGRVIRCKSKNGIFGTNNFKKNNTRCKSKNQGVKSKVLNIMLVNLNCKPIYIDLFSFGPLYTILAHITIQNRITRIQTRMALDQK